MKNYRSMLFVPATDSGKINKALASNADCVILDLEDSVALSEKKTAQVVVKNLLRDQGNRHIYVRVNSIDTPFLFGDLTTIIPSRPTGIMLPKTESADHIKWVDWLMGQLERESGLPAGQIGLIALIETGCGVIQAASIAGASGRLKCIAFGAIDYTLDIGTKLSKEGHELFYARAHIVAASRAGGCEQPIDTVYPNFRDAEGLKRESEFVRNLGYQGKMVIHPGQIEIVHQVFSPTPDEISYARKVVQAFETAEKQGIASVNLDGKMIDYPVMKRAKQLLKNVDNGGVIK
ncbi:MAG: CoA ester lyase [Deltaproteobacteria bacterium]|nr:CoA ester lyase [Deltaproteobacteria bacterium]